MDHSYIYNEMGAFQSRQQPQRRRKMTYGAFNADGELSTEQPKALSAEKPMEIPADKIVDPKKLLDMSETVRWGIYGGVLGAIIAFASGGPMLKYIAIGGAGGLGAGFLLGKTTKKKVVITVSKDVSDVLSGLKKLTSDTVFAIENELNKIKNSPALQERVNQIKEYLASKKFSLKKKADGSYIIMPPNADNGNNYVQEGVI